jgi:hypothetical protein
VSKLKNVKKIIICLFIIFFFSFFSHNAISATTIGDTTFPADVGITYTWKVTYPAETKGYKITFKSESIEKGVYNTIDVLMVNCTIRQYHPLTGWSTTSDNEFYMAANNTQNYLYFGDYMFFPNIIPTPINLTLVAEARYAQNYSIVDTTIIETFNQDTDEYTYNTDGFLTSYVSKEDGEMLLKFVLDTGDGGVAVPFGNYFIIFMVIGVVALVYLKKQKIK